MTSPDRLTCERLFHLLDDYLDRELTPDESRRVHEHLETCAACVAEYRFEESVLHHVRTRVQRVAAPAELRDRVAAAIAELCRRGRPAEP